jgi:hypothetical protein
MPETENPAADTLTEALRSGFRRGSADAASVRDEVCRYVDAARARGERVEHVIIELKQEMRAAGVVDRYARPEERAFAESVIRWCIGRYYGRADYGASADDQSAVSTPTRDGVLR